MIQLDGLQALTKLEGIKLATKMTRRKRQAVQVEG